MAWIEKRGSTYRINFRYAGCHHSRSLKTGDAKKGWPEKVGQRQPLMMPPNAAEFRSPIPVQRWKCRNR